MSSSPRYEKLLLAMMVLAFAIVAFYAVSNNRRDTSKLEPVKIGFISALGGLGSNVGEEDLKAVQLAIDEINKGGGVDGRPLDLIAEDVSIGSIPIATTTSSYRQFEKRFKERFGRSPDSTAAVRAYEAVYNIVGDFKN